MVLFAYESGFPGFGDSVWRFIEDIRFARPWLGLLLLAPILLAVLSAWNRRRTARKFAMLGQRETVLQQLIPSGTRRWFTHILFFSAWLSLVIGLMGPAWGRGDDGGVAVGRDVVLVIDLSRSMLAEDLSVGQVPRWKSAVDAVIDVVNAAEARGGDRIGIVIFAGRAAVLVPLTTDYPHLRARLESLDASRQPETIRVADDTAKSGTRIGLALTLAVETHDSRFPGHQDIFLMTDADDPANDGEWKEGITTARNAKIPVHIVGIGDPSNDSLIYQDGVAIEGPDENGIRTQATTHLHEKLAREIADNGHGSYIAAHRNSAALGEFFREQIQPLPRRELSEDATLTRINRSVWFFAFALIGLVWSRLRSGR